MKKITVSMSEDLARWARGWAAENETSVSGLLSQLLQEKRERESRYQTAYQEFLAERPVALSDGSAYPSRESLYER